MAGAAPIRSVHSWKTNPWLSRADGGTSRIARCATCSRRDQRSSHSIRSECSRCKRTIRTQQSARTAASITAFETRATAKRRRSWPRGRGPPRPWARRRRTDRRPRTGSRARCINAAGDSICCQRRCSCRESHPHCHDPEARARASACGIFGGAAASGAADGVGASHDAIAARAGCEEQREKCTGS